MSRNRFRIRTPSRLHFGLLAWSPHSSRQFGGVGLMIETPRIELLAEPHPHWHAEGPLASRVHHIAERIAGRLELEGIPLAPASLRVIHAPDEHVGLGVGTQLNLAVARALFSVADLPPPSLHQLSALTGRGQRSGIGLHGFVHGGLIVDGGRAGPEGIPPLLAHVDFPSEWAILIIQPPRLSGMHGSEEVRAFAELPPIAEQVTDRLCRLVLLGLLPTIAERDLSSFGVALSELQQLVGHCFSPAQGGIYAWPELEAIVDELRAQGLHGVGQSSWGPTLYSFSDRPSDQRIRIRERIRERLGLNNDALFWTKASPEGYRITRNVTEESQSP